MGVVLIPVFLGLCWRARGGGWFDDQGFFDLQYTQVYRQLWAVPYAVVVFLYARSQGIRLNPLLLYLAAFAMLLNGHSSHMDMGRSLNGNEEINFWLPVYTMADPLWYRETIDFIGVSVVGAMRGLILAIPFMDRRALILCLGGPLSAFGYWIGWNGGYWPIHYIYSATQIGEFLTGTGYGLLSAILIRRLTASPEYGVTAK